MIVTSHDIPLWYTRRDKKKVYELLLSCGHTGGVAEEGTKVVRRHCSSCGRQQPVVGVLGTRKVRP